MQDSTTAVDYNPADIPVVILCGGMGTRLREASEKLPKPLVDVGGKPILWHVMKTYSHFGFRRFVLCLGYKGDQIRRYFLDYREHQNDFTLELGTDAPPRFHKRGRARGLGDHLRRDRSADRHRRSRQAGCRSHRLGHLPAHLR